jgi:hypothetical protein
MDNFSWGLDVDVLGVKKGTKELISRIRPLAQSPLIGWLMVFLKKLSPSIQMSDGS